MLKDVNLYGELHRFIPALASFYGARVAEVPIRNTPRVSGESHYGIGRTFRVFFDIITIKFLLKYFTRPMHFFGVHRPDGCRTRRRDSDLPDGLQAVRPRDCAGARPADDRRALLLLSGLMMFSTGLIGEMLIRTYFESQDRRIYAVREIRQKREAQAADNPR